MGRWKPAQVRIPPRRDNHQCGDCATGRDNQATPDKAAGSARYQRTRGCRCWRSVPRSQNRPQTPQIIVKGAPAPQCGFDFLRNSRMVTPTITRPRIPGRQGRQQAPPINRSSATGYGERRGNVTSRRLLSFCSAMKERVLVSFVNCY